MMRLTQPKPRRAFHQPPGRENAGLRVEYATITALVAQNTGKALLLANAKISPAQWVPFHALETSSRIKAMRAERGRDITIQVELEFALKANLV